MKEENVRIIPARKRHFSDFMLIDVPSCRGRGYSRETLKGQEI
ncbi:MAG: hypothetical protein V1873_08990 [Verrucomicrobiota bacterium]